MRPPSNPSVTFYVGLLLCAATVASVAAEERTLPLRMEERGGVARRQWPVIVGVPFARGVLPETAQVRLATPDGKPVALQTKALCRWPDKSVKWALLDFQADLPAGATEVWRLSVDKRPAAKLGPELARRTPEGVEVRTGPLRLLARPGDAGLFRLWQDSNSDGRFSEDERVDRKAPFDVFLRLQSRAPGKADRENWLRDATDDPGTRFFGRLDRKRKVTVEENGPLRACVRVDGWHVSPKGRRAFPFTLRVHAFRGSPLLRFQHTFVASEDVKRNFVREMGVVLPFDGANVKAAVGTPKGGRRAQLGPRDALSVSGVGDPQLYHLVSFREKKRVHMTVERRAGEAWSTLERGEDPPGWAMLTNGRGSLAVGFREFRNMHPKALRVEGDGRMVVYLWPERGGKILDLRRRSRPPEKAYLENGVDPFDGRGIAVTHEWIAEYSPKAISPERAARLPKLLNEPILPYVTPEHYAATGAFGEFIPYDPKAFPRLEAALAFGFRYMRELRRAFGLDGMVDWGDIAIGGVGQRDHKRKVNPEGIPWRGYMGWCNSDFSLNHGFFLHYIRTGDRKVFLDGEAMAMHVMDIDTNHYSPEDPKRIGHGHRHDQQHWGNGYRDYCYAPNASIDLYLFTGNRRAFDVAREMADHFVATGGAYGRYMTLRFWELTGEAKYLTHAKKTLRADLGKRGRVGWPFAIGANFRSKSYDGVGYTFYDSVLPDPKLRKAFLQAGDFLRPRYLSVWQGKGHPDHCVLALAHKCAPTPENTEVLKIAVWLAARGLPKSAAAFAAPEGAPFEKFLAVNQRTLNLGRTDVFGLYYLVGLPRVMARLKAMGVPEGEAVDYPWQWKDAPSFAEVIDNKKVFPQGKSWHYYTRNQSPSYRPDKRMPGPILAKWRTAVRRHELYEDGRKLGPHPYSAAQQIKFGKKGWTRRLSAAVRFTTPDNSDPRKNGRKYVLVYVNEADAAKGVTPEKLLKGAK